MKRKKIILVSSSGGHYEQLKMLSSLSEEYKTVWITEKSDYYSKANYYMIQTGMKDKFFPLKMIVNMIKTISIWIKEKPDYIISTGAMILLPYALLAKVLKKKIIYVETYARVNDLTRTGKIMYKHADLFMVQWKKLKEKYPLAVYGGSLY